jgi:sugar PTS system EIIA component
MSRDAQVLQSLFWVRSAFIRSDKGVTTVSNTPVQAPVAGRAVRLADVPDPVFSAGMVGYGAAVDPPREVVDAVAPVAGKVLKLMPHAYVIMTADNVGVLVHLGLDTVALDGEGFTTHVEQGDDVVAGQKMITYDVPAIEARGLNPIVPVVVMDERQAENVVPAEAVLEGAVIATGDGLFTAHK